MGVASASALAGARRGLRYRERQWLLGYALILPAFAFVAGLIVYPAAWGVYFAFTVLWEMLPHLAVVASPLVVTGLVAGVGAWRQRSGRGPLRIRLLALLVFAGTARGRPARRSLTGLLVDLLDAVGRQDSHPAPPGGVPLRTTVITERIRESCAGTMLAAGGYLVVADNQLDFTEDNSTHTDVDLDNHTTIDDSVVDDSTVL